MASLLVTAICALSAARLAAAQDGAYDQTTWGSVVMAFHGERTPLISSGSPGLTALGAQQAVEAGSVIRTRFLQGPDSNITRSFPINGIASDLIDNTQLYLLAADDAYVAASAQAFMQGLYPPIGSGANDSEFTLANGSSIGFPLDGYQYPSMDVISPLDFNFVWIAGNVECPQYDLSTFDYFDTDDYHTTSTTFEGFYEELIPLVFQDVVPSSQVSYYNAYDLWDYAQYQYTHNSTVRDNLSPVYLEQLRNLASQRQFALNGNLSASGLSANDRIRAVSGRTLAGKVVSLLEQNIGSNGLDQKLSMLFGGFPPFLSFFALTGLGNDNDNFKSLPLDGSVMVFELFSNNANTTTFPDTSDLWVRFLFRNGTDPDSELLSYPLFGRGNSEVDMQWSDFVSLMEGIQLDDVGSWCSTCDSLAIFCNTFENNTSNDSGSTDSSAGCSSRKGVSAPVAGVIGAAVTIAFLILVVSAAVLCGGMRVYRNDRNRQSSLGGFKGAEKLASDTDLTIAKGGAGASVIRHERVGSWELGPASKGDEEAGATKSKHQSLDRVVSGADYSKKRDDDAISAVNPYGDPVKIDDHI